MKAEPGGPRSDSMFFFFFGLKEVRVELVSSRKSSPTVLGSDFFYFVVHVCLFFSEKSSRVVSC